MWQESSLFMKRTNGKVVIFVAFLLHGTSCQVLIGKNKQCHKFGPRHSSKHFEILHVYFHLLCTNDECMKEPTH